jgi:hypothetical protein
MSMVDTYLKRPHLLTSLVLLAAVVGLVGYRQMPVNLFPDSERPQVAVVTVYPGASAEDVEADVTRTIEKELSGIEQVGASPPCKTRFLGLRGAEYARARLRRHGRANGREDPGQLRPAPANDLRVSASAVLRCPAARAGSLDPAWCARWPTTRRKAAADLAGDAPRSSAAPAVVLSTSTATARAHLTPLDAAGAGGVQREPPTARGPRPPGARRRVSAFGNPARRRFRLRGAPAASST